tara:strand:+ start:422 stop:1984 length:1563 start_codon:yes stop_codon:yes gene_type:complete
MKTRKRTVKSSRKTLKGGTPNSVCILDDNIADMVGAACPRELHENVPVFSLPDAYGNITQLRNVWAGNNNGAEFCWMNTVLYLFMCNKYVTDIFFSRINNLEHIYPEAKKIDGSVDPSIDFVLQYELENPNKKQLAENENLYIFAYDIWEFDFNWNTKIWNSELYRIFYDHFNFYNQGESQEDNIQYGQQGPAFDAFNLFLSVFERTDGSRPPNANNKDSNLQRKDWKKLIGETNWVVSSKQELCEFLKGNTNNIIKASDTGYTCIGFIMSAVPYIPNNQNRRTGVSHYICYARITSQLWRKFNKGKTEKDELLENIIPNNLNSTMSSFFGQVQKKGHVVHGLFVRNDFLPKNNEAVVETKLTYYSDDLIRKQNLLKWMKDVDANFDEQNTDSTEKYSDFKQDARNMALNAANDANAAFEVAEEGDDSNNKNSDFKKDARNMALNAANDANAAFEVAQPKERGDTGSIEQKDDVDLQIAKDLQEKLDADAARVLSDADAAQALHNEEYRRDDRFDELAWM